MGVVGGAVHKIMIFLPIFKIAIFGLEFVTMYFKHVQGTGAKDGFSIYFVGLKLQRIEHWTCAATIFFKKIVFFKHLTGNVR